MFDVSRNLTEYYKIWLCCGAVLLALAWPAIQAWRTPLLAGLIALSAVNYSRIGLESLKFRVDSYDLLHYYVNAKYFDQLHYFDLYPAIILVDHENGGPFFQEGPSYMAQDAVGHHFAPISDALARGQVVKEKFTPEEWAAFSHDVLYLERDLGCRTRDRRGKCIRELSDELYQQLINDHGFNGTTAWTLIARPLTVVPVEYVKVLCYLDVVWLAGALALVAWAYGGTTAAWTTLFLLLTYSTRWPYLPWAFLRYDWIALLLGATALIKKGSPFVAGFAAGWSAVLRFFPTFYMWGPFCQGIWGLTKKKVDWPALRLAAGFFLAVILIQGAATLRFGPGEVSEHFENMMDHNSAEQLSSRRIGLALALSIPPWKGTSVERVITPDRKELIDRQEPLRYGLAFAAMLGMGWALRRRGQDEAFGFGFLPFFLVTTASYYYYVARLPLIPLHASDLDRLRNRVCLAYLFGLELFSNAAEHYEEGHRLFLIGYLAWGLVGYYFLSMGWIAWEDRDPPAAPAAATPEPAAIPA
jgi:hypothetical protein